MTRRLKLNLAGMWMVVGLASVILPVLLPSGAGRGVIGYPIVLATVSMFVLSFPSSLAAIPLTYLITVAFGIFSTPIAGIYLNIWLLFLLGLVQWFWLVPRLLGKNSSLQQLDLVEPPDAVRLPHHDDEILPDWLDIQGATPLERVLTADGQLDPTQSS